MKAKITGIETYLPENFENIESLSADNPDWEVDKILLKTGIKKRWITDKNETSLDLATKAALKLLKKFDSKKIDTLILVTQTPDYFLPTSACILQDRIGLSKNTKCFDVNQGCSGYIYGLSIASSYIESNMSENVLLVCAETYSKFINSNDRTNRPIFSDGASATLVTKSKENDIRSFIFGTDGSGSESLIVKEGAAKSNFKTTTEKPELFMNGASVFLFTLSVIPGHIKSLLSLEKLNKNDVSMFFFHQASKLVIDNLIKTIDLDKDKTFCNFELKGNTVSSTIPIALEEANNQKKITKNDLLVLSGFGVGLSWGSCIVKWHDLI